MAVFLAEEENEEEEEEKEEENLGKTEKDPIQNMPASQNMDLIKFKESYKDFLLEVPGCTTLVFHEIPTGSALPIRLPPCRLAHHSQEVLREEIKTLLDQDIIKSSKSPWAAPIVLLKKEDGTQYMCVDYRQLNKVTVNDPYPLSNIDDLISNLGASKYITTLDITKGYYQVPVHIKDREKTAFITPYGKYKFIIMSFGLISAPSTFQKLMDGLLNGLHDFTVAYLDDIIFHSSNWKEHINTWK